MQRKHDSHYRTDGSRGVDPGTYRNHYCCYRIVLVKLLMAREDVAIVKNPSVVDEARLQGLPLLPPPWRSRPGMVLGVPGSSQVFRPLGMARPYVSSFGLDPF